MYIYNPQYPMSSNGTEIHYTGWKSPNLLWHTLLNRNFVFHLCNIWGM